MSGPPRPPLDGLVVHGDGRGRGLGFPTANLALGSEPLPEDGIYAAWARIDEEHRLREATVSVGANPTFRGGRARRVEVHLHDADVDLYGRRLSVALVARLRPTVCFDTVDDLVAQTAADVARSRTVLAERGRPALGGAPG
ncbi:riboflavin kinase [Microbacterium sp. p3-SID336]|uniref:riboflavin kinase n=1 Tax=Microbacterium sp. p3-SID336 TaxID=2916212 RepID=UPI0021A30FC3|nr:riboflavin kinase [Microbacterium sp. p3-SID336]MCT1478181.1 riboflavin kinase [Microbacterium sp. p3-SID336]